MSDEIKQPEGDLVLRTMAMPADTNANGDIFGGWIMSQMDILAASYPADSLVMKRRRRPTQGPK